MLKKKKNYSFEIEIHALFEPPKGNKYKKSVIKLQKISDEFKNGSIDYFRGVNMALRGMLIISNTNKYKE